MYVRPFMYYIDRGAKSIFFKISNLGRLTLLSKLEKKNQI